MRATGLARLGALVSDPTRAEILTALVDGRAYTGSELARHVGVAPSTVSEHLSKLLDAEMVSVEPAGRHRYYRLAGTQVAELLEAMGAAGPAATLDRAAVPSDLSFARSCYDHLAGRLAVAIYERLANRGDLISDDDRRPTIGPSGLALFASIGVDVDAVTSGKRPAARACLDWTERRHHLAGAAGKELLNAFLANRWLRRGRRPRSLHLTDAGRAAITEQFELPLI